ncbi:cupin domain-containing protein [Aquibium sp. LZ166]|uniref:Cupin domain-containing protein n=1 Tax=Aquibium pacificus TaxID=3153579 RepID=A0ABV3SLZ3_9HYPH
MTPSILGAGAVEWQGVYYMTLLGPDRTGGQMSVLETVSPPNSGPPRHVHHDADETFVLLTGDVEFWLDGETFTRGPGQAVFVPRGREHTFRVVGGAPSRSIVILTPGGFEGFFREMALGRFRIPEDMPAVMESAARFQLTFTGPPLGVQ